MKHDIISSTVFVDIFYEDWQRDVYNQLSYSLVLNVTFLAATRALALFGGAATTA